LTICGSGLLLGHRAHLHAMSRNRPHLRFLIISHTIQYNTINFIITWPTVHYNVGEYQGWGTRGLSSTSMTARGQKVVALALAFVLNILYSNTSLANTWDNSDEEKAKLNKCDLTDSWITFDISNCSIGRLFHT